MAGGEPPEKYVLRIHLTEVTDAVEQNLEVVGSRLAEKNFITSRQVRNIVGTLGPTPASKASNLMRSVESKIEASDKREEWFEKFVLILANDTAAEELVQKLSGDLVKAKPNYKGVLLKYNIQKSQGQKGVIAPDSPAEALTTSGASAGSSAVTPPKDQAGPSGQKGVIASDSPADELELGEIDGDLCEFECKSENFARGFWELNDKSFKHVNGDGVVIAILDSGIQASHCAFEDKILQEYSRNFCSEVPNDRNVDDANGHGTCCSGIAAGRPFVTSDQVTYLGGVAPHAKLIICKICDNTSPKVKAVKDALQYVCDLNEKGTHVHVVSLSLGFQSILPQLQDKINILANQRTICVAGAGNNAERYSTPVLCPASCQNTIAVGSHAQNGRESGFSSEGDDVLCLALGENVCAPAIISQEALACYNGTSMATPAVAGLIALIIQSMNEVGKKNKVEFNTIKKVLTKMASKKTLRPHLFFSGIPNNPNFFDAFIK